MHWFASKVETYSGTSMAVPHVAGSAALLKSFRPALNTTQITALLYGGMESRVQWSNKAAHEGNLNLFNAITSAKSQYAAPVPLAATITGLRPFVDVNSFVGQISGPLTAIVSGYATGTNIAVYFLDRNSETLEPPVRIRATTWNNPKSEATVELAGAVPIPVGATQLAVFPSSADVGVMWGGGSATAFTDTGSPQRKARNVVCNTTDEDIRDGGYKSYLRWRAPHSEQDITHYRIYQTNLDEAGNAVKADDR